MSIEEAEKLSYRDKLIDNMSGEELFFVKVDDFHIQCLDGDGRTVWIRPERLSLRLH